MENRVSTPSFPDSEDRAEAERGADRRLYYEDVKAALRVVPLALHAMAWFRLEERGWFDYRLGSMRTYVEVRLESEQAPELRSFDRFVDAFRVVVAMGLPQDVVVCGQVWKLFPTGRAERRPA
jgi:hypothetical protein